MSQYRGYFVPGGVDPLGLQETQRGDYIRRWNELGNAQKYGLFLAASRGISLYYDDKTPNWYLYDNGIVRHAWEYNTHWTTVRFSSKSERDAALVTMYDSLSTFSHLNVAGNNNIDLGIEGNRGHFDIKALGGPEGLIPNMIVSIDVLLELHPSIYEVQAVTNGKHPLVGSRKFRVEPIGNCDMKILTEAWEMSANFAAQIGKDVGVAGAQIDTTWTTYINNLTDHAVTLGAKKLAVEIGGVATTEVQKSQTTLGAENDNPFRKDLVDPTLRVSGFNLPSDKESIQDLRDVFIINSLYNAER